MIHTLKTDPGPFSSVWVGEKLFELRKDDRGFEVGDILDLRCRSSGRHITAKVTHLLRGTYGLPAHLCAMSISVLSKGEMRDAPPDISVAVKS